MKLLLASSNKHKAQEFKALLPLDIEILLPEELGISFQCEEDKETFMENSILKAKALYNAELEALGEEKAIPVIADDSGLIVDALPGQLGVRTARYGSPDGVTILPAHQKNQLLLKAMENIPFEKRGAKFVCSVTCIITPYKMYSVQEECLGHILFEETGTEGFGYDPVFFCKEANSPMGLLPNYSKNNYSHRSKAVASLLKLIK